MYCPKCGGIVVNGICSDCKEKIKKELIELSQEEVINKNDKTACLLSYIFWPANKFIKIEDKKLVGFHNNQGFTLFIVELLTIASFFIPTIGKFVGLCLCACDCFLIYKGLTNVFKGEKTKLPVIGDYTFLYA